MPGASVSLGQIRQARRNARELLVQCDRCSVKGTARLVAGRITGSTIAADRDRHVGCGGRVVGFDIVGAEA